MRALSDTLLAVDVAAFKRAVHIPAEDSDDQFLIHDLLQAAQEVVETGARHVMTPRRIEFMARAGFGLRWFAPVRPVQEVAAVDVMVAGAWVSVDLAGVRLEFGHDEPQLIFSDVALAGAEQGAALRIQLECGTDQPPKRLAQAIVMVADAWFQAGISIEPGADPAAAANMPFSARLLIRQGKYDRPHEWVAA